MTWLSSSTWLGNSLTEHSVLPHMMASATASYVKKYCSYKDLRMITYSVIYRNLLLVYGINFNFEDKDLKKNGTHLRDYRLLLTPAVTNVFVLFIDLYLCYLCIHGRGSY